MVGSQGTARQAQNVHRCIVCLISQPHSMRAPGCMKPRLYERFMPMFVRTFSTSSVNLHSAPAMFVPARGRRIFPTSPAFYLCIFLQFLTFG